MPVRRFAWPAAADGGRKSGERPPAPASTGLVWQAVGDGFLGLVNSRESVLNWSYPQADGFLPLDGRPGNGIVMTRDSNDFVTVVRS